MCTGGVKIRDPAVTTYIALSNPLVNLPSTSCLKLLNKFEAVNTKIVLQYV